MIFTREPSFKRASTMDWLRHMAADGGTIFSMRASRLRPSLSCTSDKRSLPRLFYKYVSGAVDHDFRNIRVAQQLFKRAKSHDFVE